MKKIFRLGTRGSPLALIQAQIVRESVFAASPSMRQDYEIEIVPIRTSGDWNPEKKDQTFLEMGGNKGLFTKEIEEALLSRVVDFAVHSMKDVSVWRVPGLTYAAVMERADPRDALLSPVAPKLQDLPKGARVGTSSLRRKAQVLAARPDLTVVPLRGNVDTRLRKLAAEEADATILAVAGLTRLGMLDKVASVFDVKEMLPAAAQGMLGIQVHEDNAEVLPFVKAINHPRTESCALAERALLRTLDGSCRTPLAAYAEVSETGTIKLDALASKPDGTHVLRDTISGAVHDAEKLGEELGTRMKAALPANFFENS